MNYLHPSLVTPVHMKRYIVVTSDGALILAYWRKGMGDYREKGAYCTERKKGRLTEFKAVEAQVLLVAEVVNPTMPQIDAAAEIHQKLITA